MLGPVIRKIRQWWYDRPILVKGLVVVGIPVAPLVALSLLYFGAQTRAQSFTEELAAAMELARRSQDVLIPAIDINAAVRGYALSGELAYLESVDGHRERLTDRLARLRETLGDLEEGEQLARRVEEFLDERLTQLDGIRLSAEQADLSPVPERSVSIALLEQGEAALDSLRSLLEPLRGRPDAILADRATTGEDPARLPGHIVGIASVLGILGGIAAAALFSTSIVRRVRRLERNTHRFSRGEPLEPAISSRDEIGRLAVGLTSAKRLLEKQTRALQRSEEQFAHAVSGSQDGLWDWDLETDQVYYSPRWKEMLGYEEADLAGNYQAFESLVHVEDLPRVEAKIRDHIEGRTPAFAVEIRMRHRDGSWRWIISRGRCVRDAEGRAIRMAGFHTDVTRRREREEKLREAQREAEAATEAKSAFLAAMSHELRTPLNAVIGFSELLEDGTAGKLNEKQVTYVGNVLSSARHLLDLINDILDLSKVESGKMELHLEELDPLPILQNSVTIVQGTARKKGIRLGRELPGELPPLRADEARLKQIVYNLLSNAVKFTETGGEVVLGARTDEGEKGGDGGAASELRIWIRDSGIGIAPEDVERIFREFEQVESSYSRSQQGTGLGLPLTRKLIELHEGRIEVESEPGKGSTFTVHLPLDGPSRAPAHAEVPEAGEADAEEMKPGVPTVLVVEDDPVFRNLLRAYLDEEGYRVLEAGNGDQAIRIARDEVPDAITLDIVLPRKDGWQVLKELRADPRTRKIPVFAVTVTEDRELGLTLGTAGFFTKPVDRHALVEAVAAMAPHRPEGLRVLAVDDDEEARLLVREALESVGHRVLLASGGQEGIEIAREERPDVIILDLMMPEVTGFDVAAALRTDPETAAIPILVWTGKELGEEDRRRLNSQVQMVRVKGSRQDLVGALERVLATEGKA